MTQYCFEPTEILYQTDTPTLFIHQSGISTALLLKIDEDIEHEVFLVSSITEEIRNALIENQISVRGAILDADEYWVAKLDNSYLTIDLSNYAEEITQAHFLPDSGLGLNPEHVGLPDTLINSDALLTVYFQGKAFSEGKIRLSVLKNKIDEVTTVIKHAIFPDEFVKRRSNSIDLMVDSLSFGSLAISVLETKVNIPKLQKIEAFEKLSKEDLDDAVNLNIERFFGELNRFKNLDYGDNSEYVYDLLSKVLPSEASGVEKLSFLAPSATSKKITIELNESEILREKFDLSDNKFVEISGFIDDVNQTGNSIRISRPNGRLVTCKLGFTEFERCKPNQFFKTGHFARVKGIFYNRDRIDLLEDAVVKDLLRTKPT